MAVYIRSRLLLLVLAWALPAIAALLAVVYFTARSEQEANERTLRDTSRAMSMVVERELDRRALVARVLSTSRALQQLPQLGTPDAEAFRREAREAQSGLSGWVEVHGPAGLLLDTRERAPAADDDGPRNALALRDTPYISALLGGGSARARAVVSQPVLRDGVLLANVMVVLVPGELQRVMEAQQLPPGWISSVMDSRHAIVARRPGSASLLGQTASADLQQRMAAAPDGAFDTRTLDGAELRGYYSTSPHGWTYLTAMPRAQFGGYLEGATAKLLAGASVLLLLAVAGALWVARGIAGAVVSLKQMAASLSAGAPVEPRQTGIAECDDVAATLLQAARQTRSARQDLEQQVAAAVDRTREVEQQASRTQRVAALGRLTGGVAHDFNNLLGVISNSAHLVQRHAETLPPLRAPVAAILRAVDVGSHLTQQLTRFAGRRPLRPQPLDLAHGVDELAALIRQVVGKRIDVSIEVAADTRPVIVDSGELELALLNLALNARDSMPDGGSLRVQARNTRRDERAGRADADQPFVTIEVTDTGVGMDSDVAARVFEPFFTTKPIGEGTGLGLAQVHGFCTQAGGSARLASAPGQGTRVTLVLPASSEGGDAPMTPHERRPPAADSLAGVQLVLVEDNNALGEATAALLRSFGAEVSRVRDASGALDALGRGDRVDVVLSDVVMPGALDGVALGQRLRTLTPPVPVVLTSGYVSQAEALQGFDFLQKPVGDQALVEALLRAVGR